MPFKKQKIAERMRLKMTCMNAYQYFYDFNLW